MSHYIVNDGWTVDIHVSEQTVENLDGWWTSPEHSDFDYKQVNTVYIYATCAQLLWIM